MTPEFAIVVDAEDRGKASSGWKKDGTIF